MDVNASTSITLDGMLRGCLEYGLALVDAGNGVTLLNSAAASLVASGTGPSHQLEALPEDVVQLVHRTRTTGQPERLIRPSNPMSPDPGAALQLEAMPLPVPHAVGSVLLVVLGPPVDSPLQTRLKHFERLARLGTMSAGIAHEIRNALVPLSTMTELLLEKELDGDFARTIRHELERANGLAAQMLKYSRPRQAAHLSLSLHEVLERALVLVRSRIKESGARLERELKASPDTLWGDESHLEQVFVNLLLNAADAIGGDGRVAVSTVRTDSPTTGPRLVVTVTDDGSGIDASDQPNLFHPFFTTKRHGTGLGLFVAHRIVTEHGGEIVVESPPGRGTCARVTLPVNGPTD